MRMLQIGYLHVQVFIIRMLHLRSLHIEVHPSSIIHPVNYDATVRVALLDCQLVEKETGVKDAMGVLYDAQPGETPQAHRMDLCTVEGEITDEDALIAAVAERIRLKRAPPRISCVPRTFPHAPRLSRSPRGTTSVERTTRGLSAAGRLRQCWGTNLGQWVAAASLPA